MMLLTRKRQRAAQERAAENVQQVLQPSQMQVARTAGSVQQTAGCHRLMTAGRQQSLQPPQMQSTRIAGSVQQSLQPTQMQAARTAGSVQQTAGCHRLMTARSAAAHSAHQSPAPTNQSQQAPHVVQDWPEAPRDKRLDWQRVLQEERAADFTKQLKADASPWAIRPNDPDKLEAMCAKFFNSMQSLHADSTVIKDSYYWKFWSTYCESMGTTPVRSDVAAITGIDAFGFQRERWLMANAVVEWMPTIKGRNGRIQGTPESCGKRIDGVCRVLERLGLPTVSKRLVYQTVRAEMRQYALRHGPEWLQPNRKDPLPFSTIQDLILLCLDLQWSSLEWDQESTQALEAAIHVAAESGMRKMELTSSNGLFTKLDLSFGHLKWSVNGQQPQEPTATLLMDLVPGRDYAVLYPNTSKADPFSKAWGTKPIHMLYEPSERINAAAALQRLELLCWHRTQGNRRTTPLLFKKGGKPFSPAIFDKIFKEMMNELVGLRLITKEQAKRYSWHSFRASLATGLLSAGASGPQIQACCRWLSEKSVATYAAFTADAYSNLVRRALKQDISSALRSHRPSGDLVLQTGEHIQYDDSQHVAAWLAGLPELR